MTTPDPDSKPDEQNKRSLSPDTQKRLLAASLISGGGGGQGYVLSRAKTGGSGGGGGWPRNLGFSFAIVVVCAVIAGFYLLYGEDSADDTASGGIDTEQLADALSDAPAAPATEPPTAGEPGEAAPETTASVPEEAPESLVSELATADTANVDEAADETASDGETADTEAESAETPAEDETASSPAEPAEETDAPGEQDETRGRFHTETATLAPGGTLLSLLRSAGLADLEAYRVIAALQKVYDARRLPPGQEIEISVDKEAEGEDGTPQTVLTRLRIKLGNGRVIEVTPTDQGSYGAKMSSLGETDVEARASGTVKSSFYASAERAGVPAPAIMQMIKLFSPKVNFARDVARGDSFELLFSQKLNDSGGRIGGSEIVYARLDLGKGSYALWKFDDSEEGISDYFDAQGRNSKSLLTRKPIASGRLTSGFGYRRHPILGVRKLHSGIDYAAPYGTPIYAAGDGKVTRAGWVNGYGRYVEIEHRYGYSTAYGHMSRIASGLEVGDRVRRGETIGHVGSTGRSTGNHLHFEIRKNGKAVNPMSVDIPAGIQLEGATLVRFEDMKKNVSARYAEAIDATAVSKTAALKRDSAPLPQ